MSKGKAKEIHIQNIKTNESLPFCKGCPNEHGPCGTPCMACEKSENWHKEWQIKFLIWEKK